MESAFDCTFRPAWWLPGGHAQSLWPALTRRGPAVTYARDEVPTFDGDRVALLRHTPTPRAPTVLILHGLESSPNSAYVRGLVRRLHAECGWNAAVLEFRGSHPTLNRGRYLYNSGDTRDVDAATTHLLATGACDPGLFVVGFSLGGNVAARWLAQVDASHPAAAKLRGAALISAPYDLAQSARLLDRALGGRYTRYFLRSLIPKALAKERQHPGCLDADGVRRARTMVEFDTFATAPLHGYRDAWDYYEQCSSFAVVEKIATPTLLLSGCDDPLIPPSAFPSAACARNPALTAALLESGGHLGFVEGASPARARYWAEYAIVRFLRDVWE